MEKIKTKMQKIVSDWNGDESGSKENKANIAQEILDCIGRIENLIDELE